MWLLVIFAHGAELSIAATLRDLPTAEVCQALGAQLTAESNRVSAFDHSFRCYDLSDIQPKQQ